MHVDTLERMARAVEKVQVRLLRSTATLDAAKVNYAVAGDNAIAAWVVQIDPSAVMNSKDVELLIRRVDLPAVIIALENVGFIFRRVGKLAIFLDGAAARPRDAVHVIFAKEKVRAHEVLPNPDVSESVQAHQFRVLTLAALVRIKLIAYRDKDRTHLRDLLGVGLIDASWLTQLPDELAVRLKSLIDTPEG